MFPYKISVEKPLLNKAVLKDKNYRAGKSTAPFRIDLATKQRRIGNCQLRTLCPLGNSAILIG
jgi:hypothetical protein